MRKFLCSLTILALVLSASGAFAATHLLNPKNHPTIKYLPRTTKGSPVKATSAAKYQNHSLQSLKAINKLSPAMNAKITAQQKGSYVNGTIDTIPYFNSWFITGDGKNSVYTYSMVGGSPPAGGTTNIPTEVIPLISELDYLGTPIYLFDPSGIFVAPADQDSDANLLAQSPIYDATTTYPGPPADTGQYHDTYSRAQFRKVRTANWHTNLVGNSTGGVFGPYIWFQFLEYNNGDWTLFCCDTNGNAFPSFNVNTISNNFAFILSYPGDPSNGIPPELPVTTNKIIPIILTDYLFAFDPSAGCCIGGYHAAQPGVFDPNGVLVWTWGTWVPANPDQGVSNPFGPGGFGSDMMALSHEIGEIIDDPFVQTTGTLVPPWIDGSATFAQANLENGDAIEAMAFADSIYPVPLNTTTGSYTYHGQNLATLEWFTRNPVNGGLYSWPNEGTLSHFQMKPGCKTPGVCSWIYGQGAAGFFFGPPF